MKHGKIRVRWQSVLLGIGIGVLVLVCGAAAAAGLMVKGVVERSAMDLFAAGILVLAAVAGCMTARLGGGGFLDGAMTAAGELVVLMALNAGLNGGKMEGIGVTILVLAGGCGGGLLLTSAGPGAGKSRRRKRRIR